jgi:hypothetical protein
MSNQQRLQWILDFLNLKADSPFPYVKEVLRESLLCRYILSLARSGKKFSLLTRQEVAEAKDSQEASRLGLDRLRWEASPDDENKIQTFLGRKEGLIFPEDIDTATGMPGQDIFVMELLKVVEWFRTFMAGCESGRMDVGTLNEFKYTKGVIMEFKPSRNPMNPDLSAAELLDMGDDIIERKLLCHLIYPFLFSGQGQELSKIKRCRRCGVYFLGKRVSASFCGSQCRGAFYYENSIR